MIDLLDIELVAGSIEEDKCIFFLGPNLTRSIQEEKGDVLLTDSGSSEPISRPILEHFYHFIKNKPKLDIELDEDNMVTFQKSKDKILFQKYLKRYYQQFDVPSSLLIKLAQIPCHTYITVSPDLLVNQAFNKIGAKYVFDVYKKNAIRRSKISKPPTKELPIIYNLFGCIDEPDSIILEHEDLFRFIFSLVQDKKKVPDVLLHSIYQAKVFVFLGFEFGSWYLRLILRHFELQKKERMGIASGKTQRLNDQTQNFYSNFFEIDFVSTGIQEYVDGLHNYFQKTGNLRETHFKTINIKKLVNNIKKCLITDELEKALEILKSFSQKNSDLFESQISTLSGQFYALRKSQMAGVIPEDSYRIQRNQLRERIQMLLEGLSKNAPGLNLSSTEP